MNEQTEKKAGVNPDPDSGAGLRPWPGGDWPYVLGVGLMLEGIQSSEDKEFLLYAARLLFHRLWSREVGSPDYCKQEWMGLQAALNRLGVPV